MSQRKDDKLWGGRFERDPDKTFYEFQRSFRFDKRLLAYELLVDGAWARALHRAGILTTDEVRDTLAALEEIAERAGTDPAWVMQSPAEDVHHFVEAVLVARLGPIGWKLHTGRSRNELIAADLRLFIRNAAAEQERRAAALIEALAAKAERHVDVPMAGMTHLQHAQPILLAHFLLAHAEALLRDVSRLRAAAWSADACPLGSGALAGCAFPLDRQAMARDLGFGRITANSLDAVGDRDFALDYLFALAGIATHLSRLAEDFILFASQEFAFIALPDEYSTGSSLMPQKKNPDAWELIRGKTGRVVAALTALLMTLKGLPTSYQRDLQEDKEPLFAAHDQVEAMLEVAAGAVAKTMFHVEHLRAAASDPALLATELADALVRRGLPAGQAGVTFREAHDAAGKILREAEKQGRPWTELSLEELRRFAPQLDAAARAEITLEAALARKSVPGGTAPEAVKKAIDDLRRRIGHAPIHRGRAPYQTGARA